MSRGITTAKWHPGDPQVGFSLIELLITMAILLIVMSVIFSAIVQTARTEGTIANRTEMHASVRNATELLQQEIGQAGRIAIPAAVTLTGTVSAANAGTSTTVGIAPSSSNMFVGEQLVIDNGPNQETVTVTALGSSTITAVFNNLTTDHVSGAPVTVQGGFASGVVPTTMTDASGNNIGSTGTLLKLYGDINSDGNMVYIEYTCDTAGSNLYRNMMSV
jgi:prepilin-type N-terminal cleavage/methylation domain-containing protein